MMAIDRRQGARHERPGAAPGLAAAFCAAAFVASPADASAQENAAPPPGTAVPSEVAAPSASGVRTHDGFLFRLLVGAGYYGYHHGTSEFSAYDRTFGHTGGAEGVFQLGGAVGNAVTLSLEVASGWPSVVRLGPAVGFYFPCNVYVDATFGYSFFWGIQGAITLGKEWWVSDQWGLGLAFRPTVGTMSFEGDVYWQTFLYLSATYN